MKLFSVGGVLNMIVINMVIESSLIKITNNTLGWEPTPLPVNHLVSTQIKCKFPFYNELLEKE